MAIFAQQFSLTMKFCCGALCLLISLLSPGSGKTIAISNETRKFPIMDKYYGLAATTDDIREFGDDTLYITAFRRLTELFVDGQEYVSNSSDDSPNTPYYAIINSSTRLIAMKAVYDAFPYCAGILASTVSNSILTNSRFACAHSEYLGWWRLGYDDAEWFVARSYEDNTAGRSNCKQDDPIPYIHPNARWIWHVRETDPFVYCRGYTNYCDISSPCLNGGTCLNNSLEMCSCTPQFTGRYCEIELEYDTLHYTAFRQLAELFVDGIAIVGNNSDDNPNTPYYANINSSTRLIAMMAVNDASPADCAGILASTVSNSILTNITFKCAHTKYPGWFRLGYDDVDPNWYQAIPNGDNTAGRSNCYQDDPIPNIHPNAKWIWHNRITDPFVCCRGYTNYCDISSPCLNGGTCLKNSLEMCSCTALFTGRYCEIGIVESSTNPMTTSTTIDVPTTTTDVPTTTTDVPTTTTDVPTTTTDVPTTTTDVPTTTSPSQDPCTNYQFIDMNDGYRSSDFDSCYSSISICDSNLKNDTWYRFEHDAGNRLLEQPIDPWFCGTQAPIYLYGKNDTNEFEAVAQACAVYSASDTCGWSGQVLIRRCNLPAESFFVYLLAVPPACPLAYCVDASSRRQCVPPEVWISDEFRCGESASPTASTPAPPGTSCGEAPGSGWGEWGSWSQCSTSCDYGLQSRRRVCGDLPCEDISAEFQSCIVIACQKNSEETGQGAVLVLVSTSYTTSEELLLMVIQYEEIIYGQLRISLNKICSQDGSLCLGSDYTGSGPLEYVSYGDVYRALGGLTPNSDGTISLHTIAVANETLCGVESTPSSECVIPYETMHLAANQSTDAIYMNTAILIADISDPSSSSIDTPGESESSACPSDTCVVPITVCLTIVAVLVIIAALWGSAQCSGQRYDRYKKNSRNKDGKTRKDNRSSNNDYNNNLDDSRDERDGESKKKRKSSHEKRSNNHTDLHIQRQQVQMSHQENDIDRSRDDSRNRNSDSFERMSEKSSEDANGRTSPSAPKRNKNSNDQRMQEQSTHSSMHSFNDTSMDKERHGSNHMDLHIQRQQVQMNHQGNDNDRSKNDHKDRISENSSEESNGRTSPSSSKRNENSNDKRMQEQSTHSSMHSFNDASMDKQRHGSTSSERTLTTKCLCGSSVQIIIDAISDEIIQHESNNSSTDKLMQEQSTHSSMHSFNDTSMDKERHGSTYASVSKNILREETSQPAMSYLNYATVNDERHSSSSEGETPMSYHLSHQPITATDNPTLWDDTHREGISGADVQSGIHFFEQRLKTDVRNPYSDV